MPARVVFLCWALVLSCWSPGLIAQEDRRPVTVFAASSLTDAFRDIGAEFERLIPGTRVRFNFGGSQQLAAQIELGGGADVFAAADERWMTTLVRESLLLGTSQRFARNTLVVILPAANRAGIHRLEDLARPGLRLVLAGPSVPAGMYSRRVLANLAGQLGFPPDFAQRVLANVVSSEDNVRGVLGKVLLGEADGGMVYRTDLTPAVAPRLVGIEIPEAANVTTDYLIGVLRESRNPSLARRFLDFLRSPSGQSILAAHGFLRATH